MSNPRIQWIVDTLAKKHVVPKESQLDHLHTTWTSMSGQFSDAMRNNALMALSAALVCVLIYIAVRFEWTFALSAVLALVHDVLITLALLALMHYLGWPVQLDLQIIGAIMTIVGYSLNDTIVVFDRVREDQRTMRNKSLKQVVNQALNQTLSRTLMTSITTLIVLLSLLFFGGTSIFGFSFVMAAGVIVGTYSSIFIAPSLLLLFESYAAKAATASK